MSRCLALLRHVAPLKTLLTSLQSDCPHHPLLPTHTPIFFFNHSIENLAASTLCTPPPTTTHPCFTLTPFHPPGNSSAAVSTLGLLGERYGFEVHMQG